MNIQLPDWAESFWEPSRYKAFYGGRGSSKSHSAAAALCIQSAGRPLRNLCGREIQKSIKDSSKRLIEDKIHALGMSYMATITETEIRFNNGSLFLFAGVRTNPDSIKSMEGIDRFWGEEASRFSKRSLELIVPTIRKPDSEIWFTWNPESPDDPVDAMFRGPDGPPPSSIVRQVNWSDNPWFPDVLRQEMEWDRKRDPELYLHKWEGHYRKMSDALVFRNWRIEECEPEPGETLRYGIDFGFAKDPTVGVRCWTRGRALYVDYEAYQVECEIDRTPDLLMSIPEIERWPAVADSSRPETISYLRRNGLPKLLPSVKGAGSVEDGVEFLRSFDIIVHPRCRHVIDELGSYSYKVDEHTGEVLPIFEDKNNHVIDALRYALEAVRRASAANARPNVPQRLKTNSAFALD